MKEFFTAALIVSNAMSSRVSERERGRPLTQRVERNSLTVKNIHFEPLPFKSQTGPFYSVATPIHIVHITSGGSYDPFAI